MRNELAQSLRDAGHPDLAEALEGREGGEARAPVPSASLLAPREDQDIAVVTAALDRDVPDWRG